jgi:hypothetical protein
MTDSELQIIQHSLGLDQYGRGRGYRNHFCTGAKSRDHSVCAALVAQGFMRCRSNVEMYGGDDVFFVTDEGRKACQENSPSPPKLTRGQQRYADFLAYDSSLSFIEYLRMRNRREKA